MDIIAGRVKNDWWGKKISRSLESPDNFDGGKYKGKYGREWIVEVDGDDIHAPNGTIEQF